MSPKQAHHAVDVLMADSERITDAVMRLIERAGRSGLTLPIAVKWITQTFAIIEERLAEELMSQDDHEDEVIEPLVYPLKPGTQPHHN